MRRPMSNQPAQDDAVYQPRLAELVATQLRWSILHGELQDGELLPTQDDLCDRFNVGKVAVREALRILQNEGLATVRRGNIGGATVHSPTPRSAARMLAMVMESRGVQASQLAAALRELEPVCASMCANRPDRMRTVVPELRAVLHETEDALNDPVAFTRISRQFHETIVNGCGNDAMLVAVGALEAIWSPGAKGWARKAEQADNYPDIESRRSAMRTHEKITTLIEEGRADKVAILIREHVSAAQRYSLGSYPDRAITVEEFT
jgi:GntR family transcriptional regulator, transcriptional repressor for pyruvate dehydrogenase complex